MKFFLVDVKSITSAKSREQFDRTDLEKLADSILECEGLLKPLVLKPTGPETYIVLGGDMEYYAAVRAREKDPRKGEMVNAFVVPPKAEEMIVRQLHTLKNPATGSSPVSVVKSVETPSDKTPDILQSFQKELENISRKTEVLDSLPSVLSGIMQKLEHLENNLTKPKPVKTSKKTGYSAKKVDELKALAIQRNIELPKGRVLKPALIVILEDYDKNNETKAG